MKNLLTFFLPVLIVCLVLSSTAWGQTTIYTTNFGTTSGVFPTGWSTATTGAATWIITSTSASSGYTGASRSMNATATNQTSPSGTATLTCNPGISTVGYVNITVIWGARRTSTFTNAVSFEWSTDGSTWTPVTFTEVPASATWALVNGGTRLTLPVGAEGASNLQFRRVYTQITGSGTYRIDDFNVQGTASGPTITLNTSSFNGAFGFVNVGNSSSSSSFTVSGTSLTNDIIVTPPTGFEIRTGVNSFSTSPITLTQSGGSVPTTTIDARFTPLAYVRYSGSIACASTGAGTQYAVVSGTGGIKSVATGNWSSGSTWDGGIVPTSAENVYITAAFPVTIDDGSAACNSIDFDPAGTSGLLVMGGASSVLSVYGDFTLGNTTQMVFATWPVGAKIKFTGSATTQLLSGWNTSTTNSGGFMEIQVDKSAGKVTTSALNMKLTIGTSLEIVNGTFEMNASDDFFGRDLAGTATTPTITVQSGGVFTIVAGATQINSGTSNPSSAYNPIGKMTIYGIAELVTTSTSKLNFGGVDIENGGILRLMVGWSAPSLASGVMTVKSGGTLRYSTTYSGLWDNANASVVVNSGGFVNVTAVGTITLPTTFTNNGTFRYSYQNQNVLGITYNDLWLEDIGTKTLIGNVIVNGTLLFAESAIAQLGNFNLTIGPSATISGASATNFVIAAGSGELRKTFTADGSFIYPVGDATNYSPVTIITSGASSYSSAYIGVNLNNIKHPSNTSTSDYISRYWTVSASGITLGSGSYSADFVYMQSDVVGTESNLVLGKYDTQWDVIGTCNPTTNTLSATGLTSFSDFTGGEPGALPVQLASFVGSYVGNSAKLEWSTISEVNNYGFNVQRLNGNEFVTIGFVAGKGTTLEPQSYSYLDVNAGTSYRLEQIDNNGLKNYFGPVMLNPNSVDNNVPAVFKLNQNYPNPFNPATKISFSLANAGYTTLKVYNIVGSEIATLFTGNAEAGRLYTINFDAKNLTSGLYFTKLLSGNSVEIRKMTLIK